jgi:hypothetical protein
VLLPEFSQILAAVPNRSTEQLKAWRTVLEKLKRFFMTRESLKVKLAYAYQREDVAQ